MICLMGYHCSRFFPISQTLEPLRERAACFLVAFVVEVGEFHGVVFEAAHLDGQLRTDDQNAALVLQAFDEFELAVVVGVHTAEDHAQAGVFAVDEFRDGQVLVGRTVAAVARGHYHVEGMARGDGALDGDAVHDAAVEHRFAVHVHDGADKGQTTRSLGNLDEALAVAALGEVARLARAGTRGDHLEGGRIPEAGIVVEGQDLVGQAVVHELAVEDAALGDEVFQADVLVFLEHVNVALLGPPALLADIRKAIAGPRRNAHGIVEIDMVVEEIVKHTAGEDTAHSPAFKDESRLFIKQFVHIPSYNFL